MNKDRIMKYVPMQACIIYSNKLLNIHTVQSIRRFLFLPFILYKYNKDKLCTQTKKYDTHMEQDRIVQI